jgi:hypothetical protein
MNKVPRHYSEVEGGEAFYKRVANKFDPENYESELCKTCGSSLVYRLSELLSIGNDDKPRMWAFPYCPVCK